MAQPTHVTQAPPQASGMPMASCAWPLVEVSPSGTIVSANEAFAGCLGRRAADLPGTSLFDLMHPEEPGRAAALLRAFAGPPVELRFVAADGQERFLLVGAWHLSASGCMLLCCDLTQQRLAERAARGDAGRYA